MTQRTRKSILLLGADGQLGWELRRSLQALGPVVPTARRAADGIVSLDLTDADRIRTVVRDIRPALIVNAAAYTNVDGAERDVDTARAVNAVAPGLLQEEANRLGAAVVHYSTDYVFDGTGSRPWTETDAVAPLNVYGRTKADGERAVAEIGGPHLIIRTSWVYGVHGVNFVKKILRLASERDMLRIVADQIGAPTSTQFLADVTTAILGSAQGDWSGLLRERGGILHCANAGETSWHGFTSAIVDGARRAHMKLAAKTIEPIPSTAFATPTRRPLNSRLDCRRLELDFQIAIPTWNEALADTLPSLLLHEFGIGSRPLTDEVEKLHQHPPDQVCANFIAD